MEFKQHIHYDNDLENAVLGAFLIEKTSYSRVHGSLDKEVFYTTGNAIVFDAIKTMWEEGHPIDILTVTSFIARQGHQKLNGDNVSYYVIKLTNFVVSSANLEFHSFIIRQLYAERELLKLKMGASELEGNDVMERVKMLQDSLQKLHQVRTADDWKDMSTLFFEMYKHMAEVKDQELIGVPTGFSRLDLITGGLAKTQLIAIGARPSVGKSALINAIILHAASCGHNVGIISLEMPDIQIASRMSSIYSGLDFYKIFRNKLNDEEGKGLYAYVQQMVNLPVMVSDATSVNVMDIRVKANKLKAKGKLDILFIDYMQLIEGEVTNRNYNREQEVAKMSRGLKLLAMELNIPVVVLCQLNRESEKAAGKKPQLHNLRESGSIEQDCDGVIFLHRDFKVGITANADGSSTEFEADLIIGKWRNGETPEIKIGFDPPKMRFYDLDKEPRRNQQIQSYQPSTQWKPFKED